MTRVFRFRTAHPRKLLFLIAVLLQACSSTEQLMGIGPGDSVDVARMKDFSAYFPTTSSGGSRLDKSAAGPALYPGAADASPKRSSGEAPTEPGVTSRGDEIEMNFEQAEIQTVAKALLGDALGLDFAIDSRVHGAITIVSAGPIPKKDVLPTFENAIRMSNAALLREGRIIRIIPLSEANGAGPTAIGPVQPGYGVTIIPLHNTSAVALAKTAENFIARAGAIRADAARNLLLVHGTSSERQAVVDMVSGFDVEWLRNRSVGIYPLKSTSPDNIIRELERIFDTGENGQGAGTIAFQPMPRMNAVLIVTRNRQLLERATLWLRRLDRSDVSGSTVRVYQLVNGNATRIAKILNEIFVGKGAGQATDSAASQLAPGTSVAQTKLDQLSTGSSFSGNGSASATGSQNSANGQQSAAGSGGGNQISAAFSNFAEQKNADNEEKGNGGGVSGSLPKGVFQNMRITADNANNSIVVYSSQDDYLVVERSLRALDKPQMQVSIEATVAEVTLNDDLQYGVQYYLGNSSRANGSLTNATTAAATSSSSTTSSTTDVVSNLVLQRVLPGFNLLLGPETQPHVVLNALTTLTSVKVLSSPSLVVSDNQPALLQVGQQVPISTGSATVLSTSNTIVNSIQMRDTGVILKVWPHVHGNGVVQLEVEQEISNPVSSSLTPTISQRRVHSTVSVRSGQTVLLGGLISEQENNIKDGIPGLRHLTYLGDLFGSTTRNKDRSEIIIFIKPRIIRDSLDAQGVAEEFRSRLDMMRSAPLVVTGNDATRIRK
ncbi:type II secretion system secretin GspD [Methylosinus sp. R-45379]|uniref:type II secretion system secretin GspD n=1 Tax=Methylosinus sp. R-45379 TaxID=980563 RepID=UPI000A7318E0|nr:type II secretion system secretin GspD [Methylosinus sp. R-45379]